MKESLQYHELERMIALAMQSHEGQFDIGKKPYFLHPLAVMHKVAMKYSDDFELMQIAMGHDLIEDTWISEAQLIRMKFTQRVVDGIVALSKKKDEPIEDYKAKVFASVDAMRVKLMDLEHNMDLSRLGREPSERDLKRHADYAQFVKEIQAKLDEVQ